MWTEVAAALVLLVMGLRVWYRWQAGVCGSKASLEGKTVVITGASAGIGKEAAKDLVSRGARVIMACRNVEKAERAAAEVRIHARGKGEAVVRQVDTSDLASVRRFAARILKEEERLHLLINNAGIVGPPTREVTKDGLELTMATNHYGHFLLTNLLLGLIKRSAPSRIVILTSDSHDEVTKLNPDCLNFEHDHYSSFTAYGQSKLCNILFTLELTNKLQGTGVTANCVHPGGVTTEIFYKGDVTWKLWMWGKIIYLMGKDATQGAQTILHAAVSEELEGVSGKYLVDCKEAQTTDLGRSQKLAKQVWEASEVDVKLQAGEKHY
ncbi:retinol dehydrogenase 12-like [Eriocheir sinensis]|uniref:retinol dehydrogenase 12-like n=1 Tax=Eriocheir sinensis TaxID=95602 RepID=UPI0021C74D7B|nr:retinol dehydrogenase 12-like [Eriocheir sinensis]XP_050701476.1 retinol dehydrogenase 12-like [Eriocheir sinensis]XP_050701477.1 retinol dehydrogenase 12-like [Eriocheir sinensis]